jgi:hypothetical protein
MIDNFALIVGSMKCGTSSLFTYLSEHPQVASAKDKEPNFFANDSNWQKGIRWYQSLWDFNPGVHRIALEASTMYTKLPRFPNAAERIAGVNAKFRFIYIMRNPIERIESHYTHGQAAKWVTTTKPMTEGLDPQLIEVSKYAKQIGEYYKRFPSQSILLLNLDDLKRDPHGTLEKVCQFLQIDTSYKFQFATSVYNKNTQRFIDGPLWTWLEPIACYLPPQKKNALRWRVGIKIKKNIKLSTEQRQAVLQELREDLRTLKSEYRFDIESWRLDV